MMLPFGTELAAGTLRVLARRQGTVVDAEPGRGARQDPARAAPHGIRRPDERARPAAGLLRHVDATAAVDHACSHDAWRWGMPDAEVARAAARTCARPLGGSPTTAPPTTTAC